MMPRGSPCRRGSRRPLARNVVLAALSLGCALVIVVAAHSTPHDPIYSVDQVYAGLWVHPSTWVGRTVRVRGIVPQPPDPWLARLRRLPLPAVIGRALPQPQAPHNGQPAVYCLTLHDPNSCTSLTSPCPAGVVVDAQAQGW